jgi:predicted RNA-binding Zn ribbon-like protein
MNRMPVPGPLVRAGPVVTIGGRRSTSRRSAMCFSPLAPVILVPMAAIELREHLSPAMRRRFRTGRISLDFTHTGGDGEAARWEILHRPDDVARFLGIIVGTERPTVRTRDMEAVRTLRRAISGLARSRVAGEPAPASAIPDINIAAAKPPLVPELAGDRRLRLVPGTASQALSTIARDAIELFSAPLADRIRICGAPDCGLLFVDTSRPGRRRWCSMEWCGDRAKKRSARQPVREGDAP